MPVTSRDAPRDSTESLRAAEEQAALRRVATLVASESSQEQVFGAVAEEAARVLDTEAVGMLRFEPDGTATLVAQSHTPWDPPPVGTRLSLEGRSVIASVLETGRAARLDDWAEGTGPAAAMAHRLGVRSSVATPIVVEGRLWGTMIAATSQSDPLPADTESRIAEFTELVATAIANAEARAELARLADEQAALRRVATLVAEEVPVAEVFATIAKEVAGVLGPRMDSAILRYEPDDTATVVAVWGEQPSSGIRVNVRLPIDGSGMAARVFRERRAVRVDDYATTDGVIAEHAKAHGIRSAVGSPILVHGRLWGAMVVAHYEPEPFPPDTEQRVSQFTELVATAISNAEARARVLTAGDEARRRVVRDLHDGAQQRLVQTILTLKLALTAIEDDDRERARSLLAESLSQAEQSNAELRELAHGILPSILTHGGLRAGVESLVSRLDLPVHRDVPDTRLAQEVEASAYFIIAEALTNVVKHAHAPRASVTAAVADNSLRLEVRDEGIGGADPKGHGLLGIADRVAALGGRLRVDSPPGGGTVLIAELPLRN